ncbi:MAG: TIM barrel protein [Bacteroidales bacterium]|nr:TIM barrel protein [Bacteroidales bacterium]
MKRICLLLALIAVSVAAWAQHPQPSHSYLEIYDLATRTHRVVKEFPHVIEAPNWTPDGKWLVFNMDGKLWKISPDGSSDPVEIPTGDITQCNNDHVVTADGKWIGLSSNDPANRRYNSYVYVVPFEGGQPRKVTAEGPSYLHGISPDGKTAAYCAFRGPEQEQDVWAMPLKGGKEIRLTDAPGLDDGPEYSPDGKHIWFNSVRTGRMQVWKMRSNGKQQTQMTFDEDMNSWFPHISLDNQKVVYIAYHDYEVAPDSHIADLNVQLRMIPAGGGKPEVLLDFFGGQGSLNVNSWSPDSKQFAFVSYRLSEEITAPKREMAVQLYSVRTLLGTPEQFARNHGYVFSRLVQMGYTAVEAFGYEDGKIAGLGPADYRKAVESAGLTFLSSHVSHPLSAQELASGDFSKALAWWDDCIAYHKAAGVPYLVMSWSQPLQTKAQMSVMAAYLDAIGAKCRAEGIRFGYHCHSHEYRQVDGTTMIDTFLTETKPENVFLQMDVYWAVMAGVSPVEYMNKYPGRYELLHIKDKYELGESGMVGFDAIFRNFQRAGTKGFVVELEQASTPNILQGLRKSALYLRNASF